MKKFKKIAIYIGGGFLALLVVLIIISLIAGPPAAPQSAQNEDDAYHDPKLESLRERNAELDGVYERDDQLAASFSPDDGENPFAEVGELSDFDSFAAVEDTPANEDHLVNVDENPIVANEVVDPVEPPTTNDLLAGAINDETTSDDPFAGVVADERNSGDADWGDQSITLDTEESPARNTSPGRSVSGEQLESMRASLDSKIETLESRLHSELSRHQVELLNAQGNNVDSEILNNLQREMNQISTQMAAFSETNEALASTMASLKEDVSEMKSERAIVQRQSSQPTRPSATTLRNLYQVQRIENSTVTLVGQNTGRTYHFQQGDSVAHGGRVDSISGDSVTLTWGDVTTTLSVF